MQAWGAFFSFFAILLMSAVIFYGLYYFFTGKHRRDDQPTYNFPDEDQSAYKPIVSDLEEPDKGDRQS